MPLVLIKFTQVDEPEGKVQSFGAQQGVGVQAYQAIPEVRKGGGHLGQPGPAQHLVQQQHVELGELARVLEKRLGQQGLLLRVGFHHCAVHVHREGRLQEFGGLEHEERGLVGFLVVEFCLQYVVHV